MKRFIQAVGLLLAVIVLGACSVAPEQQTTTLQYKGAVTHKVAKEFESCIQGGTKGDKDLGGERFTYPGNQRVVKFTGDGDDNDRGPLRVRSSDGIEMDVFGTMQYTLNTDCAGEEGGALAAFHENIGRRYDADFTDGLNDVPAGWKTVQRIYVEEPLAKSAFDLASPYGWFSLWKEEATKKKVEDAVNDAIEEYINNETPTDDRFFQNLRLSITRIDTHGERGEQVKQAIADGEKRAAEARANEAAAEANRLAAIAEEKAEIARAAKRRAEIAGFGGDQNAYLIFQCIQTPGCQPFQPGSALVSK